MCELVTLSSSETLYNGSGNAFMFCYNLFFYECSSMLVGILLTST